MGIICVYSDRAVKHLIYSPFLHQVCSQGLFGAFCFSSLSFFFPAISQCLKHTFSGAAWTYGAPICLFISPGSSIQNGHRTCFLPQLSPPCQLNQTQDLFPPSAEPFLSTESNPVLSLLGSLFVLHFYSWGIFLCLQSVFMGVWDLFPRCPFPPD